jgi:YgiT-type zinc finger domain-containing protein
MNSIIHQCPICGGKKRHGTTTFTVDLESTLVVIKKVPATICALCGHEWLSDDTAAAIEHIVQKAKKEYRMIEVIQYREIA